MVRGYIVPCVKEETGYTRLRLEKRWWGIKTVIEVERRVEYRSTDHHPDSPPLRIESQWFKTRPWSFIGRNFYHPG
jgi:hypothetical protein